MACRPGCAACCIAPSISSPIPGMPHGKPAGQACVQLDGAGLCRLFQRAGRPGICERFAAHPEHCGSSSDEALARLTALEAATC